MTIQIYKSTDASAPVLSGTVGALIALLDACLVNGYGSKAALGWGKPFTSTNSAVYRAASGLRHYLQVNDNSPDANGARNAVACGFETMSAYNTGTGQFPTTAQMAIGAWIVKSTTVDATARAWTLIGDEVTFYLITDMGTGLIFPVMGFGEFATYKSGDAYNTFFSAGGITNSNGVTNSGLVNTQQLGTAITMTLGSYVPRSYTQIGTSQGFFTVKPENTTAGSQVPGNTTGVAYPNAVDSGLYLGPMPLCEGPASVAVRGRVRGWYAPLHHQPLNQYDTISGVSGLSGRTLVALNVSYQNTLGRIFVDLTGPW